jgi:ATP-dependent Lhr-like helicase
VHDLLLRIGDLSEDEIRARASMDDAGTAIASLERARRIVRVPVAGEPRLVAVEDAARYRDALGAPLPQGLPDALLEPVRDPLGDLVLRYARTHGPFTGDEPAARFGTGRAVIDEALARLAGTGRLVQGAFRPGGAHHEWCDADVLRTLRQRSLARLRHEVEPVDAAALGRLAMAWHSVANPRAGLDALLDAVDQLQGAPMPASILEAEILPARVAGYQPADLDYLVSAGEVVWVGVEPLGDRDGRIALYLADHLRLLLPPARGGVTGALAGRIVAHLDSEGASFFPAIHAACGEGFPDEVVDALWDLAWAGLVTNDALHAVRAFVAPPARTRRERQRRAFTSRRSTPAAAQGRWSLVDERIGPRASATEWATATARQLLARHGVVTREVVAAEGIRGGFSSVSDVLKAMEESGRVRRGLFVAGLGAMQFAVPAALDALRATRDEPETAQAVTLAATDPANPYGAILRWPSPADGPAGDGRGPTRTVGATVVLVNGRLAAYLGRGDRQLSAWLPADEPTRSWTARAIAERLFELAVTGAGGRKGLLISEIDGTPAPAHPLAPSLIDAGFIRGAMGFQAVRRAVQG